MSLLHTFPNLILPVYLPTAAAHLCQGMLLAVLPFYVLSLPSSSNITVGLALAALPSGKGLMETFLLSHVTALLQPVAAMKAALALYVFAAMFAYGLGSLMAVLLAGVMWGAAASLYTHMRSVYVERSVQVQYIGAVLTLSDNISHATLFLGALLGGFLADTISPASPIFAQILICGVALGGLFLIYDITTSTERTHNPSGLPPPPPPPTGTPTYTLVVYLVLLMSARSARRFVVPMGGRDVGLSASSVGTAVALSYAAEAAVAHFLETIRDRMGQRWLMTAPAAVMAFAYVCPAGVHASSAIYLAALLLGVASGLSSAHHPSRLGTTISTQRVISDVGSALGPIVCGMVADGGNMSVVEMLLAILAAGCGAWVVLGMPDAGDATADEVVAFSHIDLYNGYEEVA